MSTRRLAIALAAALSVFSRSAAASSCAPATGQSTCFDADALYVPAAPSHFTFVSPSIAPAVHALWLGADATYLSRPVLLTTRSPDPSGRDVAVVNHVEDVALAAAYAPLPRLEVSLIVPFAAARSGAGLAGVTSQNGPGPGAAMRDLRLGAGYGVLDLRLGGSKAGPRLTVMPRLDVTLPTGNEAAFAGERLPTVIPHVSGGLVYGRFFVESELGARLRETVEIAGTRLGSELVTGLGAGVDVLEDGLLSVGVEGSVRFVTASQDRSGTGSVRGGTLAPAEWMLSVQSRPGIVAFRLGCGTAIPLSSQTKQDVSGKETTENLGGLTAPSFRALFSVRVTPGF